MKSEQIKEITNKAIEQLAAALVIFTKGPQRSADAVPGGDWQIPSLQLAKRHAHRHAEANGNARGRLPHVAQAPPFRGEG